MPRFTVQSLLLLLTLETTLARNHWGALPGTFLPQKPQSRDFLEECEAFAALLQSKLRGGGGRDDDYYYSGERDSYQDDGDYYSSDRRGSSSRRRNDDSDKEDDYYYDDDEDYRQNNRPNKAPAFMSKMPSIIQNGDRRIGTMLLGSGSVITLLGISLFFNKTLMRLGNLLFIAGVPIMIGPSRTAGYFFQPNKTRATGCLALGIFLVFIGMPMLGMALEVFGIFNLFGNMFPVLLAIARTLPGIGPILSNNNNNNNNRSQRRRQEEEEEYYEDRWDAQDDYSRQGSQRNSEDDQYYY